jgi:hypothetical protein
MFAFDDNLGLGAHQLPRVHVVRPHRTDVVQQDKEGTWKARYMVAQADPGSIFYAFQFYFILISICIITFIRTRWSTLMLSCIL